MQGEKFWMASKTPELKETEILTSGPCVRHSGVAAFCKLLRPPSCIGSGFSVH